MKDIKNTILQKFREVYGEGEAHAFFAPGRVNLIGEHTDYNGGHVFPCALTIGTYAVARKRNDRKLRFFSMNFEHLGIITSSLGSETMQGSRMDELSEGNLLGVRTEGL